MGRGRSPSLLCPVPSEGGLAHTQPVALSTSSSSPCTGRTHHIRVTKDSGLFTNEKIENRNVEWLVDTGCTTTLLSKKIFERMHPDEQPELSPYRGTLISADGSTIKVLGQAEFNVQIGTKAVQHSIIVAEITNEGLLGMDFLQSHGMILDFARGKIILEGQEILAHCRTGITRTCRVMTAEHTIIPAGSRTLIEARTAKPLAVGDWLIEPLHRPPGEQPVLTAKVLVQGGGTRVPVEILNPTDENISLFRHTNLGVVTRVTSSDVVSRISCEERTDQPPRLAGVSDDLNPELDKLVQSIDSDLTLKQKTKVKQLLEKNKEVFATKQKPFGRTDLVTHY